MDTQVIVAIITGLFGAVITPLMAQVIIPALKRRRKHGPMEGKPKRPLPPFLHAGIGGVVGVLLGYFLISPFSVPPFSFCQDKGMGGEETVPVNPPRSVKGIVIDLKTRHALDGGEKFGFSLWEVVLYGPNTGGNLAVGATASASSEQNDENCKECLAAKAIDGDNNSRWGSGFDELQWLRIDFSTPQVISEIRLKWEEAYA